VSRTTISVSESTKELLERIKSEDESYDELLVRLVGEEEPIAIGAWSDEEAERARAAIRRNRERT